MPVIMPKLPEQKPEVTFNPIEEKPEVDPTKPVIPADQLKRFADKHFGGDLTQAEKKLQDNGYSVQRPEINLERLNNFATRHFEGDELKATEFLKSKGYNVQNPLPDTLEFKLYTPWGDVTFDTGYEISPETSAAVSGFSRGFTDALAGIQELTGLGEEELARQKDEFRSQRNAAAEQGVENWYEGGKITGFVLDPVGLAIPMAKAKTLWQAGLIGAGTGAVVGGLSSAESVEERIKNIVVGTIGGGVLTPSLIGVSRGLSKIGEETSSKVRDAVIDQFETAYNKMMASSDTASVKTILNKTANMFMLTQDDLTDLVTKSGRKLDLSVTPGSAQKWLDGKGLTTEFNPSGFIDKALVPMQDRLKKIAPALYRKAMMHESDLIETGHKYFKVTDDFGSAMKQLPKSARERFENALFSGDAKEMQQIINHNPVKGLQESWEASQAMYKEIAKRMKEAGIKFTERDFYFPRIIIDKEGLFAHIGREERTALRKAIDDSVQKSKKGFLTATEENDIINRHLFGSRNVKRTVGAAHERNIEKMTSEIRKFYADPIEAAHTYTKSMLDEIYRYKLIGKIGTNPDDYTKSFAEIAKKYTDDQKAIDEIRDIMMTRFYYGTLSPSKFTQGFKNITYGSLLGNPYSAITQLQDMGYIAARTSVRDTVASLFNKQLSAKELGYVDQFNEEFISKSGWTKKYVDLALNPRIKGKQLPSLATADALGKNTLINAQFRHYKRLAGTLAGRKKIMNKWLDVFGDDLPDLMNSLQKGEMSTNVKTLLFAEMSDIHPVGILSRPELAFGKTKEGREIAALTYTLQNYAIKYFNIIRRDVIQEFAKGNRKEALTMAARLVAMYGSMGVAIDTLKDLAMGREVDPQKIAFDNLFKTIGFNRYTFQSSWDKPVENMFQSLLPPTKTFDDVWNVTKNVGAEAIGEGEVTESDLRRAVQYIPHFGKILANWLLGGAEEYNAKH